MLKPSKIVRFALFAVVVYAALTWLWPGVDRAYAGWFRAVGNASFARFWLWPQASVHFLDLHSDDLVAQINRHLPARLPEGFEPPQPQHVRDTLLLMRNRNTPANFGLLRTSSRIMGYTPTAVLIALAIATPASLWRRFCVLVWGLVLVHFFIVVRLTVLVINNGFARDKPYALFHPGPLTADLLRRADEVLADNPTFSYLVPVFLWLMVLMALELWATLGRKRPKPAPGKGK